LADREAADRLKQALRVAMTEAGYDGWEELANAAGVSSTTVENWIYARTVPRAKELRRMGDFLRPFTSPSALESAYAGLPPEEPPVIDALRDLLPELRELVVLLRAQADQVVLEEVRAALEARRRRLPGSWDARGSEPDDGTGRDPTER